MAKNTVVVSVLSDAKSFGKGLSDAAAKAGRLGSTIVSGLSAGMKAIAGVGTAVAGLAIGGGISRALKIDEATSKLKALGYTAGQTKTIMSNALASVKGTAFGLDSAATQAASLLAAGIKPGQQLQGVLTTLANTASLAGGSLDDMGLVFSQIISGGSAKTQDLNQIAQRGIPIFTWLAQSYGVSTAELRKMIEQGLVPGDRVISTLDEHTKGIATTMSGTFLGSLRNVQAALSRLGAMWVQPALPVLTKMLQGAIGIIDTLAARLQPLADKFGTFLNNTDASGLVGSLGAVLPILGLMGGALGPLLSGLPIIGGLFAGLSGPVGLAAGAIAALVAIKPDALAAGIQTIVPQIVGLVPKIVAGLAVLIPTLARNIVGNLPLLLGAFTTVLLSLVTAVGQIVPPLLAAVVQIIPPLITSILAMAPMILGAAIQALGAIIQAVVQIIPPLITSLVGLLPNIIGALLGLIPQLILGAISLFMGIVQALPKIIPALISGTISLLPKIVITLIQMIPALLSAGIKLFVTLVTAIPKILPQLVSALVKMGPQLVRTLIAMGPQFLSAGTQMMNGLINGLVRMGGKVGSTLLNIAKGAVSNFLSFLGIHSPSRLFDGYGQNIAQGLAQGIGRAAGVVHSAMGGLSGAVVNGFDATVSTSGARVAVSTAPGAAAAGGNTYQITVQAVAPGAEVGRAVLDAIHAYERTVDLSGRSAVALP